MYKSIFQERLNIAIAKRGIKQIELADKTELSRCLISGYLSGRYKPKNDKLYLIAQVLNVNPLWLMGFDVPINNDETPIRTRIINIINSLEGKDLERVLKMLELITEYKEGN